MIIKLDGAKEYVITCIGLIGEVEEEWIKERLLASYSPRFIKNLINEMLSDKIIKRTKDNCFRLKKPKGLQILKSKSEDLYNNYNLATNNHDFAGSARRVKRRNNNTKLLEHMIDKHIPINFYELSIKTSIGRKKENVKKENFMDFIGISRDASMKYRSIFNPEDGLLKSLDEQLVYIDPDDKFFLTGKIIRKEEHSSEKQTTTRTSSSRMHGVLISEQNFYPVYYVSPEMEWSPKIENQTNTILRNSWWKKWGSQEKEKDYASNLKGSCIFYYDTPGVTEEFIKKIIQKKPKGIRPWDVYENVHLIPLSDKYIEQIILKHNYEKKLHENLFGNYEEDKFYDAVINGEPAWEVLTNDIVKIKKIKTIENTIKNSGHSLVIICYEWQSIILKEIFEDAKIVTLNENEIKLLLADEI